MTFFVFILSSIYVRLQIPVDKVVEVIAEKIVEVSVPYEVIKEVIVEKEIIVEKKVEDLDRIRKLEAQIKKFEDTIALHQLHMRYAYIDNRIYARARANAHTFIKSQLCSTARLLVL
jgi:hypothetical protein